ncbi:hypothetical protein H4219_003344 [Mycoemilia scoparia]|uniref:Uncharacterized protein n=1 Tax=Mycoemilia scoparia TaxID=417184 RepID=A0A9W8DMZ5_9FUNG|nr:hypothetical protein H4219_003344 [Mycoemilia scoparia]
MDTTSTNIATAAQYNNSHSSSSSSSSSSIGRRRLPYAHQIQTATTKTSNGNESPLLRKSLPSCQPSNGIMNHHRIGTDYFSISPWTNSSSSNSSHSPEATTFQKILINGQDPSSSSASSLGSLHSSASTPELGSTTTFQSSSSFSGKEQHRRRPSSSSNLGAVSSSISEGTGTFRLSRTNNSSGSAYRYAPYQTSPKRRLALSPPQHASDVLSTKSSPSLGPSQAVSLPSFRETFGAIPSEPNSCNKTTTPQETTKKAAVEFSRRPSSSSRISVQRRESHPQLQQAPRRYLGYSEQSQNHHHHRQQAQPHQPDTNKFVQQHQQYRSSTVAAAAAAAVTARPRPSPTSSAVLISARDSFDAPHHPTTNSSYHHHYQQQHPFYTHPNNTATTSSSSALSLTSYQPTNNFHPHHDFPNNHHQQQQQQQQQQQHQPQYIHHGHPHPHHLQQQQHHHLQSAASTSSFQHHMAPLFPVNIKEIRAFRLNAFSGQYDYFRIYQYYQEIEQLLEGKVKKYVLSTGDNTKRYQRIQLIGRRLDYLLTVNNNSLEMAIAQFRMEKGNECLSTYTRKLVAINKVNSVGPGGSSGVVPTTSSPL